MPGTLAETGDESVDWMLPSRKTGDDLLPVSSSSYTVRLDSFPFYFLELLLYTPSSSCIALYLRHCQVIIKDFRHAKVWLFDPFEKNP